MSICLSLCPMPQLKNRAFQGYDYCRTLITNCHWWGAYRLPPAVSRTHWTSLWLFNHQKYLKCNKAIAGATSEVFASCLHHQYVPIKLPLVGSVSFHRVIFVLLHICLLWLVVCVDAADAACWYSITYDSQHQHEHTVITITRHLHFARPSTPSPTCRG